jgi:hypothetical protein
LRRKCAGFCAAPVRIGRFPLVFRQGLRTHNPLVGGSNPSAPISRSARRGDVGRRRTALKKKLSRSTGAGDLSQSPSFARGRVRSWVGCEPHAARTSVLRFTSRLLGSCHAPRVNWASRTRWADSQSTTQLKRARQARACSGGRRAPATDCR